MSWLWMLTLSRVTGGWECFIVALYWSFCRLFLCVCSAGYLMVIEYIHLVDTIQIIVTKYKNLSTFSNLWGIENRLQWVFKLIHNYSYEARTVMLTQPLKLHLKYFFPVSCCAVEVFKAQWLVSFVCALKSRASSTDCIQEFRVNLKMKNKIFPRYF
jgi:hypothetical protein